MTRFQSILFDQCDLRPGDRGDGDGEPAFFCDLNLDQVSDGMLAGREEYELRPLVHTSLGDPDAVRYRHEIVRDLERSAVRAPVDRFAGDLRAMRELLARRKSSHYELERQALQLEACDTYCHAVRSLVGGLVAAEVHAPGLRALVDYVQAYVTSTAFASLLGETRALLGELAEVTYTVQIKGARVRVGRYDGDADFSAELERTFAKFRRGEVELQMATFTEPGCVLLCNESFASTNEREGSEIARQVIRAMLDAGIRVLFVTHLFELAHGLSEQGRGDALFLRAERRSDGTRTFRLREGEPLPTSYGADSYRRIFGADEGSPAMVER